MKALIGLLVLVGFSSFAHAEVDSSERAAAEVVERGLCEFYKLEQKPADSLLDQMAKDGHALVNLGAQTVVCGAEGAAYIAYKYGVKPIGKAGKTVMCSIGEGLTSFFEVFLGPSDNPAPECD